MDETRFKTIKKISASASAPDCQNVKSLQNRPGYRLRVGRYRVLFDVQDNLRIIEIEEVKKRDDRTY